MTRQESRAGKVGEYEFQFWECWDSDPSSPGAAERHWFRSVTGLEASTEEEMLQKLSGRTVGTASFAADTPPEWDRKLSRTVHLKDKDILVECCEHFTAESPHVPVSVCYRGPNGLVSSTYEEMLELLGIALPDPPAIEQPSAPSPPTPIVNVIAVAPESGRTSDRPLSSKVDRACCRPRSSFISSQERTDPGDHDAETEPA